MTREQSSSESLEQSLRRRLRQLGMSAPVEAAWVCQQITKLSGGRFEAIRFRNDTITLKATNALVAHELRYEQLRLTTDFKKALGWSDERVLRIRVII